MHLVVALVIGSAAISRAACVQADANGSCTERTCHAHDEFEFMNVIEVSLIQKDQQLFSGLALSGREQPVEMVESIVNLLQASVHLQNTSDGARVAPHVYQEKLRPGGEDNVCINGHMVPELYVLGAQKAGTSSFAGELKRGGGLHMYRKPLNDGLFTDLTYIRVKEHHIFDEPVRVAAGRDKWSSLYPPCQRDVRTVTADATPSYLTAKDGPATMMNWYGSMANSIMFVVLLREPMARMHSGWYQNQKILNYKASLGWSDKDNWKEDYERFHNMTFAQHAQQVVEDPRAQNESEIFQQSQYYAYLTNWYDTFDSHHFVIVPFLYQIARDSEAPSISSYVRVRLGLLPVQGDVMRENTYPPHPDLDSDLPSGSKLRKELEDLLANTTGAHLLAKLFVRQQSDLYNYTGSLTDEDSIAVWLTENWG